MTHNTTNHDILEDLRNLAASYQEEASTKWSNQIEQTIYGRVMRDLDELIEKYSVF